jgi:hypothetical protein
VGINTLGIIELDSIDVLCAIVVGSLETSTTLGIFETGSVSLNVGKCVKECFGELE